MNKDYDFTNLPTMVSTNSDTNDSTVSLDNLDLNPIFGSSDKTVSPRTNGQVNYRKNNKPSAAQLRQMQGQKLDKDLLLATLDGPGSTNMNSPHNNNNSSNHKTTRNSSLSNNYFNSNNFRDNSNNIINNQPYRRNPAEIDAFFKKLKAARITISSRFFQDKKLQRTRCKHCELHGIDNTWSWHVSSEAMKGHLYRYHLDDLKTLYEEKKKKSGELGINNNSLESQPSFQISEQFQQDDGGQVKTDFSAENTNDTLLRLREIFQRQKSTTSSNSKSINENTNNSNNKTEVVFRTENDNSTRVEITNALSREVLEILKTQGKYLSPEETNTLTNAILTAQNLPENRDHYQKIESHSKSHNRNNKYSNSSSNNPNEKSFRRSSASGINPNLPRDPTKIECFDDLTMENSILKMRIKTLEREKQSMQETSDLYQANWKQEMQNRLNLEMEKGKMEAKHLMDLEHLGKNENQNTDNSKNNKQATKCDNTNCFYAKKFENFIKSYLENHNFLMKTTMEQFQTPIISPVDKTETPKNISIETISDDQTSGIDETSNQNAEKRGNSENDHVERAGAEIDEEPPVKRFMRSRTNSNDDVAK